MENNKAKERLAGQAKKAEAEKPDAIQAGGGLRKAQPAEGERKGMGRPARFCILSGVTS